MSAYNALVVGALDLPDADKARMATMALDAGEPYLAAALTAIQRKPKAWEAFAKRLDDPEVLENARQYWRWLPAMVGNPELPPTPTSSPPFDPEARRKMHQVSIAAAQEPERDFMLTILNQTGRVNEIARAASALQDALASGEVTSNGVFGHAWLVVYRALRESWGDTAELERDLRSFRLNDVASEEATPLSVIDSLIAAEALGPYVRGETADQPVLPEELSVDGREAWATWLNVAQRVKTEPSDPGLADEAILPIAAELLLAAGDASPLADLVAGAPATSPLLRFANYVAVRLDRLCEGYLAHPAEAVMLNGTKIYKFDR